MKHLGGPALTWKSYCPFGSMGGTLEVSITQAPGGFLGHPRTFFGNPYTAGVNEAFGPFGGPTLTWKTYRPFGSLGGSPRSFNYSGSGWIPRASG